MKKEITNETLCSYFVVTLSLGGFNLNYRYYNYKKTVKKMEMRF